MKNTTLFKSTLVNLIVLLIAMAAKGHGTLRFENGKWFNGETFVARTMWSVEGTLRESWEGKPDSVVDLKGGWVIPPFADAHNHAFADGDDQTRTINRFLAAGVFYVKNPNNLASLAALVRPKVNKGESVDVIYSNGGLTSTGGHPAQIYARDAEQRGRDPRSAEGDAYFLIDSEADLTRQWKKILEGKPDFLKVYLEYSGTKRSRGLDPKLLPAIVRRAHEAKLTVSAHIASAADFRAAVISGIDEITHLPLEPLTADDARLAAERGVRVVTTTMSHRDTSGVPDLDALHRRNIALLREKGVPILIGSDDGRIAVGEAENLLRIGAFDARSLLKVWTVDTPRAIFPSRKLGRLAEGYEASFLVLEANPLDDFRAIRRVSQAVKEGHVLKLVRPKPSAADVLAPIAMEKGIAAAIAEYDRMRAAPSGYDTGEGALNALGYALLRHGQLEEATEVFLANVERFPESSNVYDSLGEAYMARGERDLAITNYKKSLELNPKNDNAVKMLKKLQ